MIEYENPFDEEYQIERRDQSQDGQRLREIHELRRTAERLKEKGEVVGALLFLADAWHLEHPGETLDKCFAKGQDTQRRT